MRKFVITGIPELKIVEGKICGECQIGKQVKKSHKMVQHITTSRVLELLSMDLMGPMQVESVTGKKYVFACVDDYSRYTWVGFIREKSDTFVVFEAFCNHAQREKSESIEKLLESKVTMERNLRILAFLAIVQQNLSRILRSHHSPTKWDC